MNKYKKFNKIYTIPSLFSIPTKPNGLLSVLADD